MDASRIVIDGKPATPGACIRGIAYAYASASRSVRDLAASGSLESDPATLEAFGFDRVHVAVEETPYDLALTAATRLPAPKQARAHGARRNDGPQSDDARRGFALRAGT